MDKQSNQLAVTDLQNYIDIDTPAFEEANQLNQRVKHCLALLDKIDDTIMFDLGQLSTPFDKELEGLRETLTGMLKTDAMPGAGSELSQAA